MRPDYPKMYAIVCGTASEAIDCIHRGENGEAVRQLQQALIDAEEIYLQNPPLRIRLREFGCKLKKRCRIMLPHILCFLAVGIVLFIGFVMGGVFVLRYG